MMEIVKTDVVIIYKRVIKLDTASRTWPTSRNSFTLRQIAEARVKWILEIWYSQYKLTLCFT